MTSSELIRSKTRKKVGLSGKNYKYRFDNFQPDDGQREALQLSRSFAEQYIAGENNGIGLLLVGGVGSGKTHLAAAIVNEIIDNAPICETLEGQIVLSDVLFVNMADLAEQLRSVYEEESEWESVTRRCQNVGLLVLDNFGVEKGSDWLIERLFAIVDYRYSMELPIVITTNCIPKQLIEKYGDRIADRLRAMCQCVCIQTKSCRQTAEVELK